MINFPAQERPGFVRFQETGLDNFLTLIEQRETGKRTRWVNAQNSLGF